MQRSGSTETYTSGPNSPMNSPNGISPKIIAYTEVTWGGTGMAVILSPTAEETAPTVVAAALRRCPPPRGPGRPPSLLCP